MRDSIVEAIMPSILLENGVIYYEIKNNEVFAIINVLLGNDQEQPHSHIMKLISIFQRSFPEKKNIMLRLLDILSWRRWKFQIQKKIFHKSIYHMFGLHN